MKQMIRMFAVTLSLLPLFAAAQLPTDQRLVTDVPFEFVAAGKVVPAGQYTVLSAGSGIPAVQIMNTRDSINLFSAAMLSNSKTASANYALVFHKYGDRHFLAGIKVKGSKMITRLPETKAEAELRAQNATATEEILLTRLN